MRPKDRPDRARPLAVDAAERVGAIVEAAERAAESVIDDAEEQARRYLEQAKADADRETVARHAGEVELIDSLLEQAEAMRAQAERMVAALERAREQLGRHSPERPSHLAVVADPDEGERSDHAGARLLATQMAVSGSSREEIELRLRNGFEIEDPAAILDAILGPED